MKNLLLTLIQALEGDYGWMMEFLTILLLVFAINIVLKWILLKLSRRFHKNGEIWKDSIIVALIPPLTYFVWLIAGIQMLNFLWLRIFKAELIVTHHAILKIGLILTVTWFLLRLKRKLIHQLHAQGQVNDIPLDLTKIDAINKIATILIYLIAALLLLEQTGSSMNTLIAFGGVSGLAIAFASQQIISNFFGGIMIYLTQPFHVGDWIQIPEKNIEGNVEEIGWYTTEIRNFEKRPIYVPNSMLTNIMVTNPSRMTHRRFKENLSLRFQDLPLLPVITKDLKKLLLSHPKIDQHIPPQVHFGSISAYGVDLQITAYTTLTGKIDYENFVENLLYSITSIIAKHGADFSSPTTTISLARDFPIENSFSAPTAVSLPNDFSLESNSKEIKK